MSAAPRRGRLLLVPNTLDLGALEAGEAPPDLREVLPLSVLEAAARLGHWVGENAKSTRAFLKRVDALVPLAQPLQAIAVAELPRPPKGGGRATAGASDADRKALEALLAPALAGQDLGLISEAGLPAVADPGAELVAAAHRAGLDVVSLPGPSSLVLALAASGLGGQHFAFVGYLPQDEATRAQRLRELEARSAREGQTQLAIETPYRNAALMDALLRGLQPGTRLAVACGLTLQGGWCRTLKVAEWRHAPPDFPRHRPAVFAWRA